MPSKLHTSDSLLSIYTLSQAVGRAATISEIYDAALAALTTVLAAERAAVLLFDADGVMRFKASRGLSDQYRNAVEGHSPWSADERNPIPFGIAEVRTDGSLGSLADTILNEGIQALCFIPLVSEGRLLGKVMVYFGQPRIFHSDDWPIVLTIANQIAFAIARQLSSDRLQYAHESLRLALASGSMGTWTRDLSDSERVEWSPELERIFGLQPGEFGGTESAFIEFVHPDDRWLISEAVQQAVEKHTDYEVEFRFVPKDGEIRWMIGRGRAWYDERNRPVRLAGVGIDITARKHEQEALRFLAAASRELAATVDSQTALQNVARVAVPLFSDWCSVYLVTDDGPIRRVASSHVDPAKQSLLDSLEQDEFPLSWDSPATVVRALVEKRPIIIERVSGEHYEAWKGYYGDRFERIVRELNPISVISIPLVARERAFGAIRFGISRPRPPYNSDELAVAEDVGRRVSTALETAQLYWDAKEADRRKDEFLAMLSHELRNPLAPISNALQLLALKSDDTDVVKMSSDIIRRQTKQLSRLVDELLDVSRITNGKIVLRSEFCDLAVLIDRAIETVRPTLDERGHVVQKTFAAENVCVYADPARLEQVFTNLFNNAAKYMETSGTISIEMTVHGEKVRIAVRDSGIGIVAEMLPRIFELFTQAERSLDRAQGGLGIGLTLVKRLVELHGGRVEASSPGLGKGSVFTVELPVAARPAEDCADSKGDVRYVGRIRRVLVVDDNSDAAASVAMLISHWGHAVEIAHDGPSAIELARAFHPDVALLDIGLPGLDGYEVAQRLRGTPGLDKLLLIAVTGYGQPQDRQRSLEAGFEKHFVKPVDPSTLQSLLSEF